MQLTINPSEAPAALLIDITQDPFDPTDVLAVRAVVYNQARHVLAAHRVTLPGIEADYLDSLVEAVVASFQFGQPSLDLRPAMGRVKKAAAKHRKAHQHR